MPAIFISYRRVDSAGESGHLYEDLCRSFGSSSVFMDVEGIERGDDFGSKIEAALRSATALVVVIGPEWLRCTDADGRPRLEQEDDWVRQEVARSLERGILILPVLVDGAAMPKAHEMPPDLVDLVRSQAADLRHTSWNYDLKRIVGALQRVVPWSLRKRVVCSAAGLIAIGAATFVLAAPPRLVLLRRVSGGAQTMQPGGRHQPELVAAFSKLRDKLAEFDLAARSARDAFVFAGENAIDPDAETDAILTKAVTRYNDIYDDLRIHQSSDTTTVTQWLDASPDLATQVAALTTYALNEVHQGGVRQLNVVAFKHHQEAMALKSASPTAIDAERIRALRSQGASDIRDVAEKLDPKLNALAAMVEAVQGRIGGV